MDEKERLTQLATNLAKEICEWRAQNATIVEANKRAQERILELEAQLAFWRNID